MKKLPSVEHLVRERKWTRGHVLQYMTNDDLQLALREQLADAEIYREELRKRGVQWEE